MNEQKVEKFIEQSDTLDVHSIFSTIQGEGPLAGVPAIFVRMAGCSLQCPLCDTDYTSTRIPYTNLAVYREIEMAGSNRNLVVFTGGEPLRQPIEQVIKMLISKHYIVQIETNGLHFREGLPWHSQLFLVVCSPKTPRIDHRIYQRVEYYKYIGQDNHLDEIDGLPTSSLGMSGKPARPPDWLDHKQIFLQPCDESEVLTSEHNWSMEQIIHMNRLNQRACVESCRRFGYRLSLQLHKILALP